MGIFTDKGEYSSPVSAPRLFKATVVDGPNLIPKILPQAVKSIETIHGDGGPGTIRLVTFAEGRELKSMKNKIDEMNEEVLTYGYTTIEGEILGDKYESIGHEVKFEAAANGGSTIKATTKYYTKGDFQINEDEIKREKEKAMALYKLLEAYLMQNPNAYA